MKSVDLDRHVWEGWRVRDFISDLEIAVKNIMEGKVGGHLFRIGMNLKFGAWIIRCTIKSTFRKS